MPEIKDMPFNEYILQCTNDEVTGSSASMISHWNILFKNIEKIGYAEMSSRQSDLNWYLSENGVTYNVYNDPHGLNRPWNLNTIPTLMDSKEWGVIEKGIQQRAELFNLILKDLYGKRELIKKGIVPQEVIYSHRGFIRPCDQISYLSDKQLLIYGADIARGPDGQMWIYSDRTQAPSGMGYALENRQTIGRVLPELAQGLKVRKLSVFFQHFNNLLINASPRKTDSPNIVVLTPGPLNETYFEHAYLASHLGYPLVQGNDLVARDGYLWMKSLKGLKRVDVVLRRVDDFYTDPLELREDSQLGVPGLLEVVRLKNVNIINPIGSRVLENPGLIPFIPGIARYFLKEDLILPQVASWWCGQQKERNYVLNHLNELVVRRIDRPQKDNSFICYEMNTEDLDHLRKQIIDRPYRFVAQERIGFSTTPTLINQTLEARNMAIRTFGVATEKGYEIMPGGLVRVASSVNNSVVSNQTGGLSKDFWVIDDKEDNANSRFSLITPSHIIGKGLDDLPSLTAENLYWAGRYVGRALSTSRFLRMVLKQMNFTNFNERKPNNQSLDALFRAVTNLTCTFPGFVGEKPIQDPVAEIYSVILDKNRSGSLSHTMSMFFNAYYSIRNLWSSDMWRVFERINTIWRTIENEKNITNRKLIQTLDQLITRLIAFMGLVEESILIEQGLLLYFIGLQLELSMLNISKCRSLLVVKYNEHIEYEILESLLNSHESLNIYRHSYRSYIKMENVIDLIILDQKYPRSVAFRFNRLNKDLAVLPQSQVTHELSSYEKFIFEGFSKLRLATSVELGKTDEETGLRENLDRLLSELSNLLFQTSLSITTTYFSHSYRQNQLIHQSFSE
ncbi:circularly permuted type 2 ATP-grasp protein [Mangrovibacterium lignilyticum]|uniref:circularly permuted type 2 ATP-grasp protein n=1 Tax=Mangrovibacterium lignilyticum TaxID=2668052 RepID=UPI0013D16A89|nr:circularly permuted type 2 ATP-grasp protein [Mangrovibacterium lignilyticum]